MGNFVWLDEISWHVMRISWDNSWDNPWDNPSDNPWLFLGYPYFVTWSRRVILTPFLLRTAIQESSHDQTIFASCLGICFFMIFLDVSIHPYLIIVWAGPIIPSLRLLAEEATLVGRPNQAKTSESLRIDAGAIHPSMDEDSLWIHVKNGERFYKPSAIISIFVSGAPTIHQMVGLWHWVYCIESINSSEYRWWFPP